MRFVPAADRARQREKEKKISTRPGHVHPTSPDHEAAGHPTSHESRQLGRLYEIHDGQLDRPNGIAARDFSACVLRFAITRETQ